MEKHEFKILFLDDEIYDENNPAVIARETLEDAGYNITVTDKMSDVITASRRDYYHLYLLDIDMGKVEDDFIGNGATVGEVLRRLSSIRNVVVYSARGKVADWLKAANYHFYYYVHKEWGEEKLLSVVDEVFEAAQSVTIQTPVLKEPEYSDSVLLYYEDCQFSLESIEDQFENLIRADSISSLADMVPAENPKLILIILPHTPKKLSEIESFYGDLAKVMTVQPIPNVVVCIEASSAGKQLLKIVNSHPFRIVDIGSPHFENDFKEAVKNAVTWYGDKEIFDFPDESQIVYKPMTDEEIADLRPEDWQYDEWDDTDNDIEDGRNE